MQCSSIPYQGPEVNVREENVFMSAEEIKLNNLLSKYYQLNSLPESSSKAQNISSGNNNNNNDIGLVELPKPSNVKVLIISWYPPVLKLTWNLNLLDGVDISRLNFYDVLENEANNTKSSQQIPYSSIPSSQSNRSTDELSSKQILDFDLDLAIGDESKAQNANNQVAKNPKESVYFKGSLFDNNSNNNNKEEDDEEVSSDDYINSDGDIKIDLPVNANNNSILDELKRRRILIEKSLTCFQVTYNIINSR